MCIETQHPLICTMNRNQALVIHTTNYNMLFAPAGGRRILLLLWAWWHVHSHRGIQPWYRMFGPQWAESFLAHQLPRCYARCRGGHKKADRTGISLPGPSLGCHQKVGGQHIAWRDERSPNKPGTSNEICVATIQWQVSWGQCKLVDVYWCYSALGSP
jgi:hypothetical protein